MRLLVPIATLVALVSIAAAGRAQSPLRVALLPITVHSSDPGSGYLSAGLASMLSSRLEQFDDLAVIRMDGETDAGATLESAASAARKADAQFVVYGSFTQFGEGASLDLQCAKVGDEADEGRRIFVQSGTLGEIIPKLDDLAEKIYRHVRGGRRPPASAASATDGGDLESLESRVEALERTVYRSGPDQDPAADPAPQAPSGGAGARPR